LLGIMNAADLERYLHDHIPVSNAMGISVVAASADAVELRAALAPNVNHRNTAFGGSVVSLAILAGWSLLRLGLHGHDPIPQIVIQRSTMEYVNPVLADFDAVCRRPSAVVWQRFMSAFTRRGRGRLSLAVDVTCDSVRVGHLTGVFVAMDVDQCS
jgi:thioesterase domain-containing protein